MNHDKPEVCPRCHSDKIYYDDILRKAVCLDCGYEWGIKDSHI